VAEDDAEVGEAEGFGGLDVVKLFDAEEFGTGEAGDGCPGGESDDEHDVDEGAFCDGCYGDDEDDLGEGDEDFHCFGDDGIYGDVDFCGEEGEFADLFSEVIEDDGDDDEGEDAED